MNTEHQQREQAKIDFWKLMSGWPYHGWRRLAHSVLVPFVVIFVLAKLAEKIFG
jgi:hypothetical protein